MAKQLVFLPGIGGNTLLYRWSFLGGGKIIWVNTLFLGTGGFALLTLAENGVDPLSPWFPTITGGGPLSFYYDPLYNALERSGWKTRTVPMDWRKFSANSVDAARDTILDAGSHTPCTVVAHSRGGIVASKAIGEIVAAGKGNRIEQVVDLGTPWRGSYAVVGYLGGWSPLVQSIQRAVYVGFGLSLTKSLVNVAKVLSTWPGLYELMPAPAYAEAEGDTLASTLYNPARWDLSGVTYSGAHLASAANRWITPTAPPAGVKWTSIIGDGLPTYGPVRLWRSFADPESIQIELSGDGIVPNWSALAAGVPAIKLPVDHVGLTSDPRAIAAILGLIGLGD